MELAVPGASTKLNPPRQGAAITRIEIRDDGSQVLYVADQDTADIFELYQIDTSNVGTATRMNGLLAANRHVFLFAIAPGFSF